MATPESKARDKRVERAPARIRRQMRIHTRHATKGLSRGDVVHRVRTGTSGSNSSLAESKKGKQPTPRGGKTATAKRKNAPKGNKMHQKKA